MTLILAGLALSLAYGAVWSGRADKGWIGAGVKAASVGALALLAAQGGAEGLIVAGLALGAAGDFCLARPGTRAFLAGMAAFAAGHLAYAAAWVGTVPLWGLVLCAGLALSTEVWLAPRTGDLRWPVRGYVAVICLMAAVALAQPSALVRAGALLFVVSDLMLALETFVLRAIPRFLPRGVWACYWTGQALIATGSLSP